MRSTPSSTRWCRTPPTAPCCAAAASNFTPALPRRSKSQFPDIVVAQPALLAQHCAEAGLAEKAVVYWLKAGQQAFGALGDDRSGRPAAQGAGCARRPAGRTWPPAT